MKKILLFADVGGHDKKKFYHVGDEAMFYVTYRWYKNEHPKTELTLFSWHKTHKKLDITEELHLNWSKKTYIYFPLLLAKVFIYRFLKLSFFTDNEFHFVNIIKKQDRIHFCGGGNLSSKFRSWLYYSFIVIAIAKLYKKQIILTSQTIGPIHKIDWLCSFIFLNAPQFIAIRAKTNKLTDFANTGIFRKKIIHMIDSAYTLPYKKNLMIKHKKTISIGLSLHSWKGHEEMCQELIEKTLLTVSKKYKISITLIPHHLMSGGEGPDIEFMKSIVRMLPSSVKVIIPDYSQALSNYICPASYIKTLTSQTDLVLASRYHGLVFALSSNVPAISINYDRYYVLKNNGFLQFYWDKNSYRYQIDVAHKDAEKILWKRFSSILDDPLYYVRNLKKINATIGKKDTLCSVMKDFETNFIYDFSCNSRL